jgi:hypothetical protein
VIALLAMGLAAASPGADMLLGGQEPGAWAVRAAGGYPWSRADVAHGLSGGWTALAGYQTALLQRHQVTVGVERRWLDRRWRVSGAAVGGWLYQGGTIARSGPTAEAIVRAGRTGRVVPYLDLGVQGTASPQRTRLITADGEEVSYRLVPELTLTGSLGCAVQLSEQIGLDVGLDLDWVDVPSISIPGLHVGLTVGGA